MQKQTVKYEKKKYITTVTRDTANDSKKLV